MFVVKQKPHERFKRHGADLILEQKITLEEALAGGKFTIEHLCGKKVTLALDPGKIVKPSDVMVVENLGLPQYGTPKVFGKLYLIIAVDFPKQIEESKLGNLLDVSPSLMVRRA